MKKLFLLLPFLAAVTQQFCMDMEKVREWSCLSGGEELTCGPKDINKQDERGRTILHEIAVGGNFGIVARLLSLGSDPKIKDNNGYTASYYAETNGHTGVAEFLREHEKN